MATECRLIVVQSKVRSEANIVIQMSSIAEKCEVRFPALYETGHKVVFQAKSGIVL